MTSDVQTVVVLGDVTIDWLEEAVPNTELREPETQKSYELYNPGFRWISVWGGAALLRCLLDSAITKVSGSTFDVQLIPGPNQPSFCESRVPTGADSRDYVQSLAVVKDVGDETGEKDKKSKTVRSGKDKKKPKKKLIRVETFKGFSSREAPIVVPVPPPDKITGTLRCLVVDDAANGWRPRQAAEKAAFVAALRSLADQAELVVIKPSRPIECGYLTDALPPRSKRRVVIIINADDLRAHGVDISRRLSWEKSAADVLIASRGSGVLHDLRGLGDVLVRLGSDGCVVLPRVERPGPDQAFLVFDPVGAEGAYEAKLQGTMPGATSAFVAAVTAALLGKAELDKDTVIAGLTASRCLLDRGFEPAAPTAAGASDSAAEPAQPSDAGPAPAAPASGEKPLEVPQLDYPLQIFGEEPGKFCCVPLPKISALEDWSILLTALSSDSDEDGALRPENIVREGHKEVLSKVPTSRYGKLLLVDRREIEGYRSIENLLQDYIRLRKQGTPKPLSIGVFGPPGSGKSFGIKQVADDIDKDHIKPHTFNLTQMQGPGDLVSAFHVARDRTLEGCLPMLIFDEFDCSFGSEPWGWLKYFLAPMQDGKFKDQEIHPLGPAIFVFAGGTAETFEEFNAQGDKKDGFKSAKGPDFISRLNGYINVLGISKIGKDRACVARRAVLLRSFLEDNKRTENLFRISGDDKKLQIDDAALAALLTVEEYRHGTRSLEAILSMSRLTGMDRLTVASMPSDAQLSLHADDSFMEKLRASLRKPI